MGKSQRVVGVTIVAVLFLCAATGGSVAADTASTADNDTNLTDSLSTTTNETLDGLENTTSNTTDLLDNSTDTLENTTDTLENTTDTLTNTTASLESSLESTSDTLTDDDILDGTSLTLLALLGDTYDTLAGDGTGATTATAPATPSATASGDGPDVTVETPTPSSNASNGTAGGVLAGLSGLASDLSAGLAASGPGVIGLGAILGGVFVGQVTGTPGALRSAKYGASRGLDRLFRLFAPFRYSQYDDSDPLAHENRAAVFEAVTDSPGVYLAELSDRLDISRSTLRHHVQVLEGEDLIAIARVRGYRRFYPAHTEAVELAAAMNDEATAPIVDALARLGTASVSGLADAIDRDVSTVTYHLGRLEDDGVVVRERDGRAMVNRLAPDAQEALTPLEDGESVPAAVEDGATVSAD